MNHVTCRLTAKNRDQLRNPTLGNGVWATFTLYLLPLALANLLTADCCIARSNSAGRVVRYYSSQVIVIVISSRFFVDCGEVAAA